MPVLASVDGARRHFREKKAPWRLRFPKKEQNRNRCTGQDPGLRCAFSGFPGWAWRLRSAFIVQEERVIICKVEAESCWGVWARLWELTVSGSSANCEVVA